MDFLMLDEKIRVYAEKKPNNIAIECGCNTVTYSELEKKSNKIANCLIDNYCENKNVFVFMNRTPELVEVACGIIKSGGVFVPVDSRLPENRVLGMLNEVKTQWIITTSVLLEKVKKIVSSLGEGINILVIDAFNFENKNDFNDGNVLSLEDYMEGEGKEYEYCKGKHCYIFFTSGSTGKPKAVLGRYKSLMQFINWEIKEMEVDESYRISQLTAMSFDVSLRDIFVPICAGGTLCIPEDTDMIFNPNKLLKWIDDEKITLIHTVPALFKLLSNNIESPKQLQSLKYILLAGEILRGNDVKKFLSIFNESIQLVNMYGPTETTLAKCFYKLNKSDMNRNIIPVGKPIDLAQVYVLNKNMKKCDVGIIGELYIRTPFITSGYYNDRELTKKVFMKNPFNDNSKDIIYKTGDLGRILADGNIEIIGRGDKQVKIRGVRIEIGEIENSLLKYDYINDAIVILGEDEFHDKTLHGFFIADKKVDIGDLKKYLLANLPEYMIPSSFIQVDKMPLNNNGKVDRKALLKQTLSLSLSKGDQYKAPRNKMDKRLVSIWSEVLGVNNISIDSNFFEIGGHSLKSGILIGKIHKEFDTEVSFREVFDFPTIEKLSDLIVQKKKNYYQDIEVIEEKEYYEVSSAQKRLYILQQIELASTSYNITEILDVNGHIELQRIEYAFNKLIERHEALRTSFINLSGNIVQKIEDNVKVNIDYIDIKQIINEKYNDKDVDVTNEDIVNEEIDKVINEFVKPFNLSKGPLFRVKVIKVQEEKHLLLFDIHHIILDGTSKTILIKDFIDFYKGKELEKLRIQYKEFAAWQNKYLKSDKVKSQEKYWLERFKGEIPVLNIPTDYTRPSVQSNDGEIIVLRLGKQLTNSLNLMANETGSTMYMVLLAAVNILLSKYSGQEDILIGTPIAGRSHVGVEKVIGMFVNTLVMRNNPQAGMSYKDFLKEVKVNAIKAYENGDLQFQDLVEKLNVKRDLSRNPLFDVMFILQNMDIAEMKIDGLDIHQHDDESKIAKFDLFFAGAESEGEVSIYVQYCTSIFKKETVERMCNHLKNILDIIVKKPDILINDIDIIDNKEKDKIIYEFNDTSMEYPRSKTINQLFEEQVQKTPNNIAVRFDENVLTYSQLNEKSNKVARVLRKKGIKVNSIVGIMLERSIDMIVAIIGTIKSGAAYMPIDTQYPNSRISYMIEDSKINALLIKGNLSKEIDFNGQVIDVSDMSIADEDESNLERINKVNDLLYLIYTSGSTGNPKGVMIEHRTISNLISFENNKTNICFNSKVLQFTSMSFDVCYQEVLSTLLNGGELYLITDEKRKNTYDLLKFIDDNKIDIVFLPTSYFKFIVNEDKYLNLLMRNTKHIILAGEQLVISKKLRDYINSHSIYIHNHYGPSETHVVTTYTISPESLVTKLPPIGKPIQNTKVYIVDKNFKVVPIGVSGEIYIAGDCLGRGYINRQELTAEKFIENPLVPGEMVYKTGDLGKWLPDGNIEFLGRIDYQVKIRGYRVELGEIEKNLLSYKGITKVAVIDKKDKVGNKFLCAYIVSDNDLVVGEIRQYLAKTLPEYMIPTYFIKVDKIQLSINGKVDRSKLPSIDKKMKTGAEYEAPRNKTEKLVLSVWKEVLDVNDIGINDNFFDLGGNSLKMLELNSKLTEVLQREILLIDLFRYPNIKSFVDYFSCGADNEIIINKEIEIDDMEKGKQRVNKRMERMRNREV